MKSRKKLRNREKKIKNQEKYFGIEEKKFRIEENLPESRKLFQNREIICYKNREKNLWN